MKIRYTCTVFALLFFTNLAVSQSAEWRILGGMKTSSMWLPFQPYKIYAEYTYWQIDKIEPVNLGSFSLLYSRNIKSKWACSLGINYNAKGYKEKGTFYSLYPNSYPYEQNKVSKYMGVLIGIRYRLFEKNTWKMGSELFINPESEIRESYTIKKIAVSAIMMMNIEKTLNKHFSIEFNPFFETSLMNYSKRSISRQGANMNYFNGLGLMLGLKYSLIN